MLALEKGVVSRNGSMYVTNSGEPKGLVLALTSSCDASSEALSCAAAALHWLCSSTFSSAASRSLALALSASSAVASRST